MNCEKCKFSYVDTTGVSVHLRCYLKNKITPDCESFEEEKEVETPKKDEESTEILKIIFRKEVDIPQLLKSSCAKGYNTYIRVTYNWNKEADKKHFLSDEEFDRIKRSFKALK